LKKANAPAAQQFVKYMMSDGYLGWLGMAPEGKVPVRSGTATEPTKFSDGWKTLKTGVDTKASLSSIYDAATMKAIEDAPAQINRWAIPEGQGSLLGTVNTQLVLPKVIAALGAGSLDPASAAKQAADAVAQVQSKQK
jgi:multiple sugar transport system substrate-binding protein